MILFIIASLVSIFVVAIATAMYGEIRRLRHRARIAESIAYRLGSHMSVSGVMAAFDDKS